MEPVTGGRADLRYSYVPPPPPLQLEMFPRLLQLLENTFAYVAEDEDVIFLEEMQEGGYGSKPKEALVVLPGVWEGPSDNVVDLSEVELKNEPSIVMGLKDVLAVLKRTVKRRRGGQYQFDGELVHEEERERARALEEIDQVYVKAWTKINVGPIPVAPEVVPIFWKKLFSCAAILKIALLILDRGHYMEVIRECDLGILVGEPVGDNVLSYVAEELGRIIMEQGWEMYKIGNECEAEALKGPSSFSSSRLAPVFPLRNKNMYEFQTENVRRPPMDLFLAYMNEGIPCVLLDILNHWPAMNWTLEHIEKVAGFRTVPVDIGRIDQVANKLHWTQQFMTISQFIHEYIKPAPTFACDVAYIYQFTLFNQIPKLCDVIIPDYCTLGKEPWEMMDVKPFFGTGNISFPCQFHPKHCILAQVFGTTAIRLFPPSASPNLRPYPESTGLSHNSQVDVEALDLLARYPDMQTAVHSDVKLKPGQALYIPANWWYYVKSLSPSFYVHFWYQ